MGNVIGQSRVSRSVFRSYVSTRCVRKLLLIVLSMVMVAFCGSLDWAESKKTKRTPITVKELRAKFALSESIEQPVKIENRIIEDKGDDKDNEKALTFLNGRLSKGHGIELVNCEIKGDLNFLHKKDQMLLSALSAEYRKLISKETLNYFESKGFKYVAVVDQPIRMDGCTIDGSIRAWSPGTPSAGRAIPVFTKSVRVHGVEIKKDADFWAAAFGGKTDFSESKFLERADFAKATFTGKGRFYKTWFGTSGVSFSEATFDANVSFGEATLEGGVDFGEAKFKGGAGFYRATFGGRVSFHKAKFRGASFNWATFQEQVSFSKAKFRQSSRFDSTRFKESADFTNAEFFGSVNFGNATFSQAHFFECKFEGQAYFSGAAFAKRALFRRAKFIEFAQFHSATFRGEADFGDVDFEKGSVFDYAMFCEKSLFESYSFGKRASFWGAKFMKKADFSYRIFEEEACFEETTFADGLTAIWARFDKEVSFDSALFKGEVRLSGVYFGGPTKFHSSRFPSGALRIKTPVLFDLCTFKGKTSFLDARFQEPVVLSSSVIAGNLSFDNVRFEDDLELSGIKIMDTGRLSFNGARCKNILFGSSKPFPLPPTNFIPTLASERVGQMGSGSSKVLAAVLCSGSSADLTGAFYSRLLFLNWDELQPAIGNGLKRSGSQTDTRCDNTKTDRNPAEQKTDIAITSPTNPKSKSVKLTNAQIAALRQLARNYQAFGSKSDALKSYAFYREKLLDYRRTQGDWNWLVDWIVKWTTGFGAHKDRLAYWFLGLWLIPWAVGGYWRPGVVVAAEEGTAPPKDTLWNWVGSLDGQDYLRKLRMIAYSLWFSFNMFVPAIEVFGFKRWAPSDDKILEVIPIRYYSLATVQRIMGWVLIPIAIAAFAGLFGVK